MLDRRDQPARIKCEFVDEVSAPKLQSQTIFENFAQALPRGLRSPTRAVKGTSALDGNSFRQPRIKTEAIALRADERPANGIRASLLCSAQFRAIARGFAAISFRPPGAAWRAKWEAQHWVRNSEAIRQDAQDAFARIGITGHARLF
jgi:hypothetical protein